MCLILLNMNIIYWRLVLKMFQYLQAVMTSTLLHFPVIYLLDMASKTCWTVVGSFMPMLSIQTIFLFLACNAWLHGILFVDWDIYYMLWCSQYCSIMPMVVPLGGKLTFTSNISYLVKGWSYRSIFNVGRVDRFLPSTSSEPGDYLLPNLLLCSSYFSDEQYLIYLMCVSHHCILALIFA